MKTDQSSNMDNCPECGRLVAVNDKGESTEYRCENCGVVTKY